MKSSFLNKNRFYSAIWVGIFPMLLVLSFFLGWKVLSSQNFLYEFWYDNTKLESFVDFYAPQNRLKPDFALTNRDERIRIFSEILAAVNNEGEGLDRINYYDQNNQLLGEVLNVLEVEHLKLVAKLISFFFALSFWTTCLFILCFLLLVVKKAKQISLKKTLTTYLAVLFASGLLVLIIGPAQVFIFLHEQFFPADHQWFFYYQESLMTTLMMAPDLFAYFAYAWIGFSLVIFFVSSFFIVKLYSKMTSGIVNVEV